MVLDGFFKLKIVRWLQLQGRAWYECKNDPHEVPKLLGKSFLSRNKLVGGN